MGEQNFGEIFSLQVIITYTVANIQVECPSTEIQSLVSSKKSQDPAYWSWQQREHVDSCGWHPWNEKPVTVRNTNYSPELQLVLQCPVLHSLQASHPPCYSRMKVPWGKNMHFVTWQRLFPRKSNSTNQLKIPLYGNKSCTFLSLVLHSCKQ